MLSPFKNNNAHTHFNLTYTKTPIIKNPPQKPPTNMQNYHQNKKITKKKLHGSESTTKLRNPSIKIIHESRIPN